YMSTLISCTCHNPSSHICFFLQAEDGIRDRNVTGVQTCALPISRAAQLAGISIFQNDETGYVMENIELTASVYAGLGDTPIDYRSEERRVGKECRSRESTYLGSKTRRNEDEGL